MLARAFRLRRAADFTRVYKQGHSVSAGEFYIKARSSHLPVSRVAIVVSKKVSKKAVVRNRLKRQFSEALRQDWSRLKPGFDIVVMVKSDPGKLDQAVLRPKLISNLQKLGVV